MKGQVGRLVAVMALSVVAAFSSGSWEAGRRYIQPKVLDELGRAAERLDAGAYDEAEARLDLVLAKTPLAVSLDTRGLAVADQVKAMKALQDAVALWRSELGDEAIFQIVPREMAQVRVVWTEGQLYGGRCAGQALWSRQAWSSGGRFHSEISADIEIATRDADGRTFPEASLTQAAAHELGHVLGMDDSGRKGDLMGPVRVSSPVLALSTREQEAIDGLRTRALGLAALCAEHRQLVSW